MTHTNSSPCKWPGQMRPESACGASQGVWPRKPCRGRHSAVPRAGEAVLRHPGNLLVQQDSSLSQRALNGPEAQTREGGPAAR